MKLAINPNESTLRTPGQAVPTTTRSGARIARVIALSGVIGLFACEDATAPAESEDLGLSGPSLAVSQRTPLGMIGLSLMDATGWVLPSINDAGKRAEIEAGLKSLANNLTIGNWDAARANVTKVRELRMSLDPVDATEIGPVEVSLDQTDNELKAIGK